jgi:asparagine synthase (glutamine-hydrolysing)
MCGIVGFNWHDEKQLKKMMAAVAHRRPNESGYYLGAHISLGHQRLNIVDLVTGKKPINNEDYSQIYVCHYAGVD